MSTGPGEHVKAGFLLQRPQRAGVQSPHDWSEAWYSTRNTIKSRKVALPLEGSIHSCVRHTSAAHSDRCIISCFKLVKGLVVRAPRSQAFVRKSPPRVEPLKRPQCGSTNVERLRAVGTPHMGSDIDKWIAQLKQCDPISETDVKLLCHMALDVLVEESNVQQVSAPVTICGLPLGPCKLTL